jgi:TolA-binding protein
VAGELRSAELAGCKRVSRVSASEPGGAKFANLKGSAPPGCTSGPESVCCGHPLRGMAADAKRPVQSRVPAQPDGEPHDTHPRPFLVERAAPASHKGIRMLLRTVLVMAVLGAPAAALPASGPAVPAPAVTAAVDPAKGAAPAPQADRFDAVRAQVGKAIKNPKAALDAAALGAFRAEAERLKSGDDALLIGWLGFARKDWDAAITWFRRAKAWGRDKQADEGLVWSLSGAGRLAEAEDFAYARRANGEFGKIYVDVVSMQLVGPKARALPRQRLTRFERTVQETRSAAGAEALAWHLFKRKAYSRAKPWFERAIAWGASESRVLGLAYTHQNLGEMAALRSLAARYRKRYPAVATLERQLRMAAVQARQAKVAARKSVEASALYDEAVADFKAWRYKDAMAGLDAHERLLPRDEAAGVMRGWTLYMQHRYQEAQDLFARMNRRRSTKDTLQGMYYSCAAYTPEQFCYSLGR